ncbi:MAG: hypothetical protein HFH53_09660 [Hespellia sp.]|jgi:hypothetical protein|nr:hypothetical protein [Hespellia sp.]
MYDYVKDKVFLKESYSICADIVNQLVQNLKSYGIQSRMSVVGSKKRGLVTQNEKEPIDYDFNLWIESAENINIVNNPRELKQAIIAAFNEVLEWNDWKTCDDSTSAITTKQRILKKGNKTPFSIDVCIVRKDGWENWYRLVHKKVGNLYCDQYYWQQGPTTRDLNKKEECLKANYWIRVRDVYLKKKNLYLSRQDMDNHPSYNCYIEAVNEVYTQVRRENGY